MPAMRTSPSGRGVNPCTLSVTPQNQVKWYSPM